MDGLRSFWYDDGITMTTTRTVSRGGLGLPRKGNKVKAVVWFGSVAPSYLLFESCYKHFLKPTLHCCENSEIWIMMS